jgi:hypothetical protein
VFQQTLQNVSNPLSIAHDSRVGDWIVADSGSTAGIGQIKKCTVRLHAQEMKTMALFLAPRNNTDFREKHFH